MMRVVRGLIIALLTALAGCVLAVPVGDYLTKLAHVPEMEGQRGMTVFFLCVPLGIMAGLVVGVIASIVVRRQGPAGFLIALGWSLLIVCGIAGLLGGCHICSRINLPRSMANASNCNSSYVRRRH